MTAHALVLAAGAGRRFGACKLVADYRGKPLISWATSAALATRAETVTVVLGARADDVLAALPFSAGPRLGTIRCPNWAEGLSGSLRCGIQSLPAGAHATLIFLGDMPHAPAALGNLLLDAVLGGAPAAVPSCGDRPAHPVAIGRALFDSVRALRGDSGARSLLRGLQGVAHVATDDRASLLDVDTQDDLRALAAAELGPEERS